MSEASSAGLAEAAAPGEPPEPLVVRQYQLGCLSLYSYLVGDRSSGRAVVVDPQRDIREYVADAEADGLQIERVIETHFHADFVSGHLELAAATGATISYGDRARADFAIEGLAHGQHLSLGSVDLEVRHTPGHTPESISVVIRPSPEAEPWAVLTGDTLFIGDVGRPDLLTSVGWTADDLANQLYHSVHEQLLTLPDPTVVYPAHGAGSSCGKSLSAASASTIGEQRATNYALQSMSEDEFVQVVTDGQGVAPLYFAFAADQNRRDRELLHDDQPDPLDVDEALRLVDDGAVLIDTRAPETFASGHLERSVNVGLDGRFAEFAGDVVRAGQPVVLTGDPGRGSEARVRLARIGFDQVLGEVVDVEHVLVERPELAGMATRVPASELRRWVDDDPELQLVDVRNPGETAEGTIPGARPIPLPTLLDHIGELDKSRPVVVYCAGGYRSSVAASTLRAAGFSSVADLLGGYQAWVLAQDS
jgi:glyoxylase-like metal-dependent hydrolase (beta-lactamase superfamily II)/rhodanese-related sulfurtransferase